jgi:hypothetical protein
MPRNKAKKNDTFLTIRTDVEEMVSTIDNIRRNFELMSDRVGLIESRLDRVRWSLSESSGTYSQSMSGTTRYRPPTLKAQLEVSGKNPVFIGLVQVSEKVATSTISVGGISIVYVGNSLTNYTNANVVARALIGSITKQAIIHATLLGFDDQDNALGSSDYVRGRTQYATPSQVAAVDFTPVPGVNEYELIVENVGTAGFNPATFNIQDCQLLVMELGLR